MTIYGKYGYIDMSGKVAIPQQFAHAYPFSEGLAAVWTSTGLDGKWVYIDKTGKVAIPLQFESAGPFREGLASVKTLGKQCYIDKTGRYIWDPTH